MIEEKKEMRKKKKRGEQRGGQRAVTAGRETDKEDGGWFCYTPRSEHLKEKRTRRERGRGTKT